MIVATRLHEEWCEHCLHPIDVNEAVTEAFKLVGEIDRKFIFTTAASIVQPSAYFNALMGKRQLCFRGTAAAWRSLFQGLMSP
jgi:hypothetical protein